MFARDSMQDSFPSYHVRDTGLLCNYLDQTYRTSSFPCSWIISSILFPPVCFPSYLSRKSGINRPTKQNVQPTAKIARVTNKLSDANEHRIYSKHNTQLFPSFSFPSFILISK